MHTQAFTPLGGVLDDVVHAWHHRNVQSTFGTGLNRSLDQALDLHAFMVFLGLIAAIVILFGLGGIVLVVSRQPVRDSTRSRTPAGLTHTYTTSRPQSSLSTSFTASFNLPPM